MSTSQLLEFLGLNHTAPSVKATTLPSSYFKFPPANEPASLPPPPDHPTLAHPFTIPADIYNALLSPNVPITIALVYVSIVSLLNAVNANRKYKPWAISKTRLFKLFVILHNTFLAVYSAWTFVGMVNALRVSFPSWKQSTGLSETVDVLCKLHGPRGHGNAATYNATTSAWSFTNRLFHLGADGLTPEFTDVGRIWNEGLAFYGWLFYLSKFYEVIDTFIILAKGKKSSLLQTYHHAGAMLCMWAGIRYMSPPIWMFALVNSFIHTIMYTFYLFSVIGIRVPKKIKQTLTTLQITQFVVGVVYAFAHLFVAYQIPVSVPYVYRLGDAVSSVLSSAPTDASSTVSVAVATASAGTGAWLKKLALRAAGHEGLAENVLNEQGRPFGIDALHMAQDLAHREEIRFRDELHWVHCLDTSGQVFAILLNVVYLLPLTWLFAQFFVTAYLKRVERRRSSTASEKVTAARQSLRDASKGVARRLSEVVEEMHRTSAEIGDDEALIDADEVKQELKDAATEAKAQIQKGTQKLRQAAPNVDADKIKKEVQRDLELAKQNLNKAADKAKAAAAKGTDKVKQQDISEKAQAVKDNAAQAIDSATANAKAGSQKVAQNVKPVAEKAATSVKESASKAAKDAKPAVEKAATNVKESAEDAAENAKPVAEKAATNVKESAEQAAEKVKPTAEKLADNAKQAADQVKNRGADTSSGSADDTPTSPESTPNGDGTGAEEATGQSSPEKQSSKKKKKNKKGNNGGASGNENGNGDQESQEKREEDKIIDESQPVRDEDVDKVDTKPTDEETSSEVRQGTSFADAVKE